MEWKHRKSIDIESSVIESKSKNGINFCSSCGRNKREGRSSIMMLLQFVLLNKEKGKLKQKTDCC